jgi:hypothetical protein
MTWDDVAQSYANLVCGGEGEGSKHPAIAKIAKIAGIAKTGRAKTLTTDQQ